MKLYVLTTYMVDDDTSLVATLHKDEASLYAQAESAEFDEEIIDGLLAAQQRDGVGFERDDTFCYALHRLEAL